MIIVRDTRFADRHEPPAWMAGAADLQEREDANGRLWGIGNGMLLGPAPAKAWKPLVDGYESRIAGVFHPVVVLRKPIWCPLHTVVDQDGNQWMVPQILDSSGTQLVIQVKYGEGWQPKLSPLQQQAKAAAEWARQSLTAVVEGDGVILAADACKAASELLSAVYYLSPEVIAAESLLDQGFVSQVLRIGAGWTGDT